VRDEFPAFFESLTIAGRDGTLRKRMRRGPARGRCRGKTGTLSGVSSLSGYCQSRSGDTIVFSILINRAGFRAKKVEDRMVQAIAAYNG
jgi:D-alanyl-D-alanine carboxypeptidase